MNYKAPPDNSSMRNQNNYNDNFGRHPLHPINNRNICPISDSESDYSNTDYPVSISVQTDELGYKKVPEPHGFFTPQEFISIIVDIIVEFKPLNLDNVVFFRISTDLHYYFQLFTGLNIDSFLFRELVLGLLSNLKRTEMFENQIYSDDTKRYCCLNLSTTNHTIISLPTLEFHINASFPVTVTSTKPRGIIAVKFSEESSSSPLRWTKTRPLSEETKDIIQNQQFWSWIPGSVCLVRLPFTKVQDLHIDSVERAVIILTQIASPGDGGRQSLEKGVDHAMVLHRTTFYLIDHNRYVPNVLCRNSSFQAVKRATYRNNDSNIAYVCNLSIRARCQPAKIQFLHILNINDVSQLFLNSRGKTNRPVSLVVSQLQQSSRLMHNCQPVFDCYARVIMEPTAGRELLQYDGGVVQMVDSSRRPSSVINIDDDDDDDDGVVEVIVISDSEDEQPVKERRIARTESATEVIANGDTRDGALYVAAATLPAVDDQDNISVISFTDDDDDEVVDCDDDVISINSSTGDDDDSGDCSNGIAARLATMEIVDSVTEGDSIGVTTPDTETRREKCLVPISATLCGQFEGKVVRLMHVQRGVAAICLLQSSSMMRRELLMLDLAQQELVGVMNCLTVTDYFLW